MLTTKQTNHTFRTLLAATICCALASLFPNPAKAQTINPGVLDPTNTYEGKTYGQWSAAYRQWLYSLPVDKHPLFDTADVSVGQTGDVWFLGGTYTTTTDTNGDIYGTATRDCVIPQGKSLFFPLIDSESSPAEGNGTNNAVLLAHSQAIIDGADNLGCSIDGQSLTNITSYRASSDLFTWGPLPTNNVFGDPVHFPAGLTSPSVSDGYFLMVQSLSPGDHSIHFTGGVPGFKMDITYNLTVTPTNGVYPPGTTLYGKTYGEWSAAFGQYAFGLATTNSPGLINSITRPFVPLAAGQDGPVWFISGNGGNYSAGIIRPASIPAGTTLFAVIGVSEDDNVDCPHTTTFTTSQLRAAVTATLNQMTSLICAIDGVAVGGLTNVLTTPYRVQSPVFSYTMPSVHNWAYDEGGLTCYQNANGIPYTVEGAVNETVSVLIPPLSVGAHTIKISRVFQSAANQITWNLTVTPVAPVLTTRNQGRNLALSWPQSATNYMVEATSRLDPPNWQPADLPVSAVEGSYQVTAPVGANSQFFRLRQH